MADRTDPPRCSATAKSTGERCKRRPHPGAEVCVKHGAGAPQVQAAARRRLEAIEQERAAREAIVRFGLAEGEAIPDLDPREVLAEEMFRSVRAVRALDVEVDALTAIYGETFHSTGRRTGESRPHALWVAWTEQRAHLKAVAEAAHRAGLADFQASIEAGNAALIAQLLRAVVADPDAALEADQRHAVLTVAARHLRQLEGAGRH